MLHEVIARLGLADHHLLDEPVERGLFFALGFLVLDTLICKGPLQGLLLRAFGQDKEGKEGRRRFLSQLASKVVGIIFLSSIMPFAFRALADPALGAGHRFLERTRTSEMMVEVGMGYFVYDIAVCLLKFSDNGWEFMLHAVVCCSAFSLATAKGIMHYFGAAFLMWELSTPLMYLRWLMLKAGFGSSALMPLVNLAFMLVFFGCRNVWGPIMTWEFWQESAKQLVEPTAGLPPAAIWLIRVMCVSLNCLNAYWFSQMVRIALKGGKPKTKAV